MLRRQLDSFPSDRDRRVALAALYYRFPQLRELPDCEAIARIEFQGVMKLATAAPVWPIILRQTPKL